MKIYSIKNERIPFFNRPIYTETENEALSYLQNVLSSDADRALHHLKDDLALYELGEIDFTTGKIVPYDEPVLVTTLVELFNTIPAERIPQTANQLRDQIAKLREELEEIKNKEVQIPYDESCRSCRNYRKNRA